MHYGKILTFLIVIISSSAVYAFELFPDYYFIDEAEVSEMESPLLYSSEYESDYLTYFPEYIVEGLPHRSGNLVSYSIGSFDTKQFMTTTRMKVKQALSDSESFRADFIQEQHRTDQKQNLFIELGWRQDTSLRLSIIGQAQFHKRNNDLGVSVEKVFDAESVLRVVYWRPDFVRTDHNNQSDLFISPHKPQVLFVSYLKQSQKKWFYIYAKAEPWVHWSWPSLNGEYLFERYTLGVDQCRAGYCFKFQIRNKFEKFNTDYVQVQEQKFLYRKYFNKNSFKKNYWGIYLVNREFKLPSGNVTLTHVLPHFQLQAYKANQHSWLFGGDITVFTNENSSSLPVGRETAEYRANVKYRYAYSDRAYISFFFTFDMDELLSKTFWEGGAGEFVMQF